MILLTCFDLFINDSTCSKVVVSRCTENVGNFVQRPLSADDATREARPSRVLAVTS